MQDNALTGAARSMFCLECYGKGFLLEKLLQVCLHAPQNFLIIYDEISSGTFENIIFNISTSFETTQIISSAICSSPPPSRCRQTRYFYQQRQRKRKLKDMQEKLSLFIFLCKLHSWSFDEAHSLLHIVCMAFFLDDTKFTGKFRFWTKEMLLMKWHANQPLN